MTRLPPLNALRAFDAAARHGSFTLAAAELCVTAGAISRQIKTLEEHFGFPLFARGHRLVTLTEAGERYHALIAGPFAELARAGAVLTREQTRREIRLDCVPTLAMHWLLPRLERFRADHPGLDVTMKTSIGPVDPAQEFHLSIRRDPAHFAGLAATPLMTEWCVAACGPAYAARLDLRRPEDLARATVLQIRAREDLWPSWCAAQGIALSRLGPRLTVDHTFVAMQAAEDGLGVAVLPLLFAARLIDSGRLTALFDGAAAVSGGYCLLRRHGPETAEIAQFRDWLVQECRAAEQAASPQMRTAEPVTSVAAQRGHCPPVITAVRKMFS